MLSRIIYFSKNHTFLEISELKKIFEIAQQKNQVLNITGLLYHNENYFLQVLEGDRSVINKLYNKILYDNRHSDVTLVSANEIDVRNYGNWSMLYVNEINIPKDELIKYLPNQTFSPESMTSRNIETFALNIRPF